MDIKEFLKCEIELLYKSEVSFAYKSKCTVEDFFAKKIYKDKRLLAARLTGVKTDEYVYHGTGPK